jgi:aryl-alcohol dehydrogenase-like predicted oxidoreductase
MIDTAPGYGDGNSESIIGEVMRTRRREVFLATKCGWSGDADAVIGSVHRSLERLQTDTLDLVQFHGAMFTDADFRHITQSGPLDGLRTLRDEGKVRFLGITSEEPWTLRHFVATGEFDVIQVRYNLIYQSAAHHLLDEAKERNVGVVTMRSLTSGIFQRFVRLAAPEWQAARDVSEVALQFLLSDRRVDVANVGMRWPEEVERNVALVDAFRPTVEVERLPRGTRAVYEAEDAEWRQKEGG